MKDVEVDSKVCDKNQDGDVTAKNQGGFTLDKIIGNSKSQTQGYFDIITGSEVQDE